MLKYNFNIKYIKNMNYTKYYEARRPAHRPLLLSKSCPLASSFFVHAQTHKVDWSSKIGTSERGEGKHVFQISPPFAPQPSRG